MTAAIKRNPARKPAKRKGTKKPGLASRLMSTIPFSAATWQRLAMGTILACLTAMLLAIAIMLGIPHLVGVQLAEAVGRAGFAVKRVELTGINRMERLNVYAVALDQTSRAMPLVDVEKVRRQLLQYPWIADARVSRRLPDTLVVDIVERVPAAVWQNNQELTLIDAHGTKLEPVAANALPDLPLVIGSDANLQTTALTDLMDHAPRLKPMLAAATWVGNRRWDLKFQSGETLALPEGDTASAVALMKFATLDGTDRLLGRGFARFDMRTGDQMYVRVAHDRPRIDRPAPDTKPAPSKGAA